MKNLFITWAKCLGLVFFIPTLFCLLPFAAALDSMLDGHPYRDRLARYYWLLTQIKVKIEPML